MSIDWSKLPLVDRAKQMEKVIADLEGWTFGGKLRFAAFGYDDQLHISLSGGWKEIDGFAEVPGLREFADNLNVVMTPVIQGYAQQLRQSLSEELHRQADNALQDPRKLSPTSS